MPGYSGAFCEYCPKGTYKYGYSYGACMPCLNAPLNSYYSNKAWATADCPYECNEGYESVDVNPDCLNAMALSVQRLGTDYMLLAVVGFYLFLTFVIWAFLIRNSSNRKKRFAELKLNLFSKIEDRFS